MAYYFNEAYYIRCKLAQLKSNNLTYTEDQLKSAIANAYQQPYSEDLARQHYEDYGRAEDLNPNPYFNEYEYLQAKANQLNSRGETTASGAAWTADDVLAAITAIGMIPAEHYERYGCYETDASNRYINPSNAFDANAYWSAKLFQLQTTEPDAGWTMQSMLAAFQRDDLSPVSHYAAYGWEEVDDSGIPFVQTVPVGQRVPNDPARDAITEDIVPTNYMEDTPPPRDSNPRPVEKPADVGGLVTDETISPPPVHPEKSAPIDSVPPYTIQDGFGVNILAPTTSGTGNASDHWIVVDNDSDTGIVMDRASGRVLGEVGLEKTTVDGRTTAALPEEENLPEGWLFPTDKNELPPGCDPDYSLNNNFITDPVTDETGVTAYFDATEALFIVDTIKTTGSSVTLDENGNMSWTGYRDGAEKPAEPLGDEKILDASFTEKAPGGDGILTITTHKTALHYITGSLEARNHILAENGALVGNLVGGSADDTITVAKGAVAESVIAAKGGADIITIYGQVEAIQADLVPDPDRPDLDLGGGADTITIKSNGIVNSFIFTGYGNDTINIETGATVGGRIFGGDGDDSITLETGAHVGIDIQGGAGNDVIDIHAGAFVDGHILGGQGADTIYLNNTARSLEVAMADNGLYTVRGVGEETVSAANFDIVTDIAEGFRLYFTEYTNSGVKMNSSAGGTNSLANATPGSNSFLEVFGAYDSVNKTFTAMAQAGTSDDRLIIYDANHDAGAEDLRAVVLVGVPDNTEFQVGGGNGDFIELTL